MMRSGEQRQVTAEELRSFEGLVHSTARMFASQVKREEDDLAQELRIRVWKACAGWNPAKGMPLKRYVYSAIANKVKDYKRDAAREAQRQERFGLSFLHIEDFRIRRGPAEDGQVAGEPLDNVFQFVEHKAVFGGVDDKFTLPAGVTEREAMVLLLLMMEVEDEEIVVRLGILVSELGEIIKALREKFADWRPSQRMNSSQRVEAEPVAA